VLRRFVAAGVLGAVIVVPSFWVIWLRASEPSDRTLILPASSDWTADGLRIARVVGPSPLRVGDLVVAVDGVGLADLAVGRPHRQLHRGDQVRYRLRRGNQQLEVRLVVGGYPFARVLRGSATMLPFIVVYSIVAGIVFLRRPDAATSRALLAAAGLAIAGRATWPFGLQVLDLAGGRGLWTYVVGDVANLGAWTVLLHFALVLPDGRPLLRARPRLVVAAAYALPWLLYAGWAAHALLVVDEPLARLGRLLAVSTPTAAVYPGLMVIVLTAGWQRVADPARRARLRWVVSGLTVSAVLYIALGQLPNLLAGGPLVPWEWQPLGFLVTPLAISWAIVRYQLFDIEAVLRRSVVYAAMTLAVFAAYLLVSQMLAGRADPRQRWAALASSALLVAAFTTVRDRLRELVGRALFGLRDDPAAVAAAFRQIDPTGDPAEVLKRVAATLATVLRLSYAAVELAGPDGRFQPVTSTGHPPVAATPTQIPLTRHDAPVGRLLLAPGPRREPFGPADQRLLDEVGQQVSNLATSALLAVELQRARRQLVVARADERRRLRRDLHDRIGPALAGSAMQLEAARPHVRHDPDRIAELLTAQAAVTRDMTDQIYRAVDGLRPRVLDQLGLRGALETRTRDLHGTDRAAGQPRALPVTIEVDGELGELPAAVEVAAFNIVMEAVTNVARHAHATSCTVHLIRDRDGHKLRVEVRDDGCGLPAGHPPGVGLRSMRIRAEELGGSLTVTAASPTGTLICARLPIDEP